MEQRAGSRGDVPIVEPASRWERLWGPFWVLPLAIVVAAVLAGFYLPVVDHRLTEHVPWVFQGGPDGARSVLSTIASAMISVTGLVFSITMVVLQLASSQFTPRVLGDFLSSRVTQVTLGVFTASFAYSLTVLRSVRGGYEDSSPFVPQLSVTLAFVLVLASVGCFIAFINHITTSIQVSNVISAIGDRTVRAVSAVYPVAAGEEDSAPGRTWSPDPGTRSVDVIAKDRHGHVARVDYRRLVRHAQEHDTVIQLLVPVGGFVVEGREIARIWGGEELDEEDYRAIDRSVRLASTRTMHQEVGFGVRQLADIADRALSPGINDPTTAVQVVHELHRVLSHLVMRAAPSPYVVDDTGTVRLVHQPQRIEDLLVQTVRELAHYGRETLRLPAELRGVLDDLLEHTHPRYRPTLEMLRDEVAADADDQEPPPGP
jgi:uncharacterized membrane protein